MTEKQDRLYWREWGALSRRCKAEGWTLPDRHELHERALRVKKSHTDFTNADFDKVLGVFRGYSQVENFNAQMRQERQPRVRLEHKIKIEQVKLLAITESETLKPEFHIYTGQLDRAGAAMMEPDFEAAWAYVVQVMTGKFGTDDLSQMRNEPVPTRRDEKSDLECLRDTLDARINSRRNEHGGADRGWSIHDLKTAAGVFCGCALICGQKTRRVVVKREEVGV